MAASRPDTATLANIGLAFNFWLGVGVVTSLFKRSSLLPLGGPFNRTAKYGPPERDRGSAARRGRLSEGALG